MEGLTRAFVDLNLWSVFVTLCNTCITFLVVRHFLFGPLRRLLADREREVRGLYARAETERREAAAMKRDYTVSMEMHAGRRARSLQMPAGRPRPRRSRSSGRHGGKRPPSGSARRPGLPGTAAGRWSSSKGRSPACRPRSPRAWWRVRCGPRITGG